MKMTEYLNMTVTDYETAERECCKESCIVVYHYGLAAAHCYRGTHESWEALEGTGYFRNNSSYMIVGANGEES